MAQSLDGLGRHKTTILEHGHRIAQPENFIQAMADIEDQLALSLERPQQGLELVDLRAIQRCRWLIEDEHLRIGAHTFCDFHQLLFANRETATCTQRIQRDADPGQHRAGLSQHARAVQQTRTRPLPTQQQVFSHGQVGEYRQFLEHRGNAGCARCRRIAQRHRSPVHQNFAFVGLVNPCEQFHQRRFAGAVFACDGMDGSRFSHKIHVLQRHR